MKRFLQCFSHAAKPESGAGMTMSRRRTLDVDAEYTDAFQSKSFLNLWALAHQQPKPPPFPALPDFLLEPTQTSLLDSAASAGCGGALLEYLDATLQSFSACTGLLDAIARTRSLHHAVRNLLFRLYAGRGSAATLTAELARHIDLGNPLSSQKLSLFHQTHALFQPLLAHLSAEQKRLRRRSPAVPAASTLAIALVASVAVSAVIIATHGAAALVVAAASPALAAGRIRRGRRWVSVGRMNRAGRRVDVAERGAYIVWRNMDTVSSLVRRVHDEVEHWRDEVQLVLGSGAGRVMAKEVVKEMKMAEAGFQEQIEELEENVVLCLLTINRSRRLVAEEMAGDCSRRTH